MGEIETRNKRPVKNRDDVPATGAAAVTATGGITPGEGLAIARRSSSHKKSSDFI